MFFVVLLNNSSSSNTSMYIYIETAIRAELGLVFACDARDQGSEALNSESDVVDP